jgi:FtsH-binding integral membrane protein
MSLRFDGRLLGKVLGYVSAGFAFTALGSYIGRGLPFSVDVAISLLALVLIFVIRGVRNHPGAQLLVFYLFTFLEGATLGPTIAHHLHKPGGAAAVFLAAVTTACGMFLCSIVAYVVNIDYAKFRGWVFALLLGLLGFVLMDLFFHLVHPHVLDVVILIVFAFVTVFDFARIRIGGGGETAVELAVSIYLDALNIFLAIQDLMGSRD